MNLSFTKRGPLGNVISYAQLKDQSINLVVEKGEGYVGHGGAYFRPDGQPGCLLGELAAQQGATRRELGLVNFMGVSGLVERGYLIPADDKTENAMFRLQRWNDSGARWFSAVCAVFGMSPDELRAEIEARRAPEVTFDAEGYVGWVSSYPEGAEKQVIDLSLPVHAPVVPHVLAA